MYTIITKWSPNSINARYFSFAEIETILAKNNIENGLPMVDPVIYDAEIYSAWATSLEQYRNYFLTDLTGIDYNFFTNNQGSVITIQTFDLEETHTSVLAQPFYNDFVTARQAFAALVNVSFEIKKTSAPVGTLDSYEAADSFFSLL